MEQFGLADEAFDDFTGLQIAQQIATLNALAAESNPDLAYISPFQGLAANQQSLYYIPDANSDSSGVELVSGTVPQTALSGSLSNPSASSPATICYINGTPDLDGSLESSWTTGAVAGADGLDSNPSLAPVVSQQIAISSGAYQWMTNALQESQNAPVLGANIQQIASVGTLEGKPISVMTYSEALQDSAINVTSQITDSGWTATQDPLAAGTFLYNGTIYVIFNDQILNNADSIFVDSVVDHEFDHVAEIAGANNLGDFTNLTETFLMPSALVPGVGGTLLAIPGVTAPAGMTMPLSEIIAYGVQSDVLAAGNDLGTTMLMPSGLGFSTWSAFNAWFDSNFAALNKAEGQILSQ